MSVTCPVSPRAGGDGSPETYDDFQSLDLEEVRRRAEAVEAHPSANAPTDLPCARAAWRQLYREMRRSGAATVAHLKRHQLERHASKLGYGYFRIRVSSRDAFMPLPR